LPSVPSILGFQNHHFNAVVSWAVDAKGEIIHAYA
jgi:sulfane dehydrogenase subunit SoxC